MITISSCSRWNTNYLTEEEISWLSSLEEGEVSVLFGYESPPDAFTNDQGIYTGLLVDYLKEIEGILGITFPIKFFSTWNELIKYAETNNDYIIVGLGATERRRTYMTFTSPFFTHSYTLVTRINDGSVTLSDMAGKKVCAVAGYTIFDILKKTHPDLELIPVSNDRIGLQGVQDGEYDGILNLSLYNSYHIREQHLQELRTSDDITQEGGDYRIGVAKNISPLAGILDKTIKQISPERKQEMTAYWRDSSMKKVSPQIWKGLFFLLGMLLLIIFLSVFWLYSLKREVKKQTNIILESEKDRNEVARVKSLKVLAGGISHDFNNSLMGLQGFADLIKLSARNPEEVINHTDMLIRYLDDARKLNQQLMIYAKGGDTDRQLVSLAGYLEEMVNFSLHGKSVSCRFDIQRDLHDIMADKVKIGQIISNLVINAVQSMSGDGSLWVNASNTVSKRKPAVRISIKDNGPGIPKSIQGRIFDPYFTTKKKGNGLGLASCQSIVTAHGGSLELVSAPGEGAEFIVTLPVNENQQI